MSTHDTERLLVDLLNRHAEDAMAQIDTDVERDTLSMGGDGPGALSSPTTDRWTLVVAASVAAAMAVGTTLWVSDLIRDDAGPAPAGQGTETQGIEQSDGPRLSDVAAAQGFVDAFMRFDTTTAATYMSSGSEPWDGWLASARRNEAWLVDYLAEPCEVTVELEAYTSLTCPYSLHFLRSEEVGVGPFEGNSFYVQVNRDGDVVGADNLIPFEDNGIQQYLEAVDAWVENHHPADSAFMVRDEQTLKESEWPRWSRLWGRYSREYAASR